jgi:short subunit dehydrogenase-like uncharacterized protein
MATAERYDFVVFGASGFTGRYVAFEAARRLPRGGRLALAGRDSAKLEAVATELLDRVPDAQHAPMIIVADVNSPDSLVRMARSARVLINCVGPFRFYGEAVVRAAVAGGCDYVDITGEPEFMERVEAALDADARAAGVAIVPSCGFDSVPADFGAVFAARALAAATPGAVATAVEETILLQTGPAGVAGHFATFESAVHGVSSAAALQALRRSAAPGSVAAARPERQGARLDVLARPHWHAALRRWRLPFPGADASVVRRSQRRLAWARAEETPVQFAAYFGVTRAWTVLAVLAFGAVLGLLSRWRWGRQLLLRFPRLFSCGVFSHRGPSEAQLAQTAFTMTLDAAGYAGGRAAAVAAAGAGAGTGAGVGSGAAPDTRLTVRVAGPEPGYVATPILVVACAEALLLLRRAGRAPSATGVLTPAAAFREPAADFDALLRTLGDRGVRFAVAPRERAARGGGEAKE